MLTEEDFRDQHPSSVQAELVGTQEAYHVSYFVELVRLAFLHMKKLIAVEWVGSYPSGIRLGVRGMMKHPSFLPLIFNNGSVPFHWTCFKDHSSIPQNQVSGPACYT
ncbi:hypothetical protein LTS17_000068 [Exophiala oligosperma]